jgi:hypothetical protein
VQEFDWSDTAYGKKKDEVARDTPEPLAKPAVLVFYVHANLYHVMLAGCSVTGTALLQSDSGRLVRLAEIMCTNSNAWIRVCGFPNFSGSDCDSSIYIGLLRHTYQGSKFLFADNQAVVNNGAIPHLCLSKRHKGLSYHQVFEVIAAKVVNFFWVNGKDNPADIVSKHWAYPQLWHMLQPILF